MGVDVAVGEGVTVGVIVGVGVTVGVGTGVCVGVTLAVGVAVTVGDTVALGVGVGSGGRSTGFRQTPSPRVPANKELLSAHEASTIGIGHPGKPSLRAVQDAPLSVDKNIPASFPPKIAPPLNV